MADKDSNPLAMFGAMGGAASKGDVETSADAKSAKKPCRVCDSFKTWRRKDAKQHAKEHDAKSTTATTTATAAATAVAAGGLASSASSIATAVPDDNCPPDSQILGRATWTFLHTMAAYYPEKAEPKQQEMMTSLLTSFSHFYPCGRCASHLRQEMSKRPPPVDTRYNLSQWLCGTHNKVNVMLGKDEFDCSKIDERWRDGPSDGSCSWAKDVEY